MSDQPAAGAPSPSEPPTSSPTLAVPVPQIPPHHTQPHTQPQPQGQPQGAAGHSPRPASELAAPAAASPLPSNALAESDTDADVDASSAFHTPHGHSAPHGQAQLTDAQKADVIRRHLLNAEEQQRVALDQAYNTLSASPRSLSTPGAAFPDAQQEPQTAPAPEGATAIAEEYPTPYHLQGGDVVAGVYKWVAQQQQQQQLSPAGDDSLAPTAGPSGTGPSPLGTTQSGTAAGGAGVGPSLRRSRSVASIPASIGGPGSRRTSLATHNGGGDAARAAIRLALGGAGEESPSEAAAIAGDADSAMAVGAADDDPHLHGGALTTSEMLQPGGFRRDFVLRRQQQQHLQSDPAGSENASLFSQPGATAPSPGAATGAVPAGSESGFVSPHLPNPAAATAGGGGGSGGSGAATPVRPVYGRPTRSFIDFLTLYGHFGGEDLEEIEEEDEEEEDEFLDEEELVGPGAAQRISAGGSKAERAPLLRNRSSVRTTRSTRSISRKRLSGYGGTGGGEEGAAGGDGEEGGEPSGMKDHGDATVTQAVMMLLKSFVGTGVLFLGKAFYNGGILFSVVTLCFIPMVSLYSFLLLVQCSLVIPGSFGDIGGQLYGKYMRLAILCSIVLSQVGFVAAYTVFISQNLQAFFMAVSHSRTYISVALLITAQTIVFLPFALIRNIQKLSGTALVADVFIVVGLIYIFSNEIALLGKRGVADVKLFNSKDFPLLIGTAVFAFEGIGLILPVAESMREPQKFPRVLTGVMIGTMLLFAGGGALGYLTYGSKIQTVVFVNLPQDDKFVNASQFLYSIAILLSTPLQLFPAVRIMENGLFAPQKSGKRSLKVKWEKNAFRTLVVVLCAVIAWVGAADLDKFVSLIGSLACVPLGLIYPALLHLKACAQTRRQKVADVALITFGVAATLYTSVQTIQLLTTPSDDPA
ncbi:hypothetical protein JCM8202_001030 [Rhodotorula sphaerocarpa]